MDREGRVLDGCADPRAVCPRGSPGEVSPCVRTYRKAARQVLGSGEATVFRCSRGLFLFAAPADGGGAQTAARLVLVAGPVFKEGLGAAGSTRANYRPAEGGDAVPAYAGPVPVMTPQKLLEAGQLAQTCLRSMIAGHRAQDVYARSQMRLMTLCEVSPDLSQAESAHELHALVLNALGMLFDVDSAAILWLDAGGSVYRARTAMGTLERSLRAWKLDAETTPLTERFAAGRVIQVTGGRALVGLGLPEEAERVIAIQLGSGDMGPRGLLVLVNTVLGAADLSMIRGLAMQLSLAMERQRLNAVLEARSRELRLVRESGRRFLSCLEPDRLYEAVLDEARKTTGACKGSLMLADPSSETLSVKAVVGIQDSIVRKLCIGRGRGAAGRVFSTGEALLVRDVESDGRFLRKNRSRYETRSFVCLPILVSGRVLGVLNLSDKVDGEVFSEDDLRMLQGVAVQAAMAIERSTHRARNLKLKRSYSTDPLTGLINRRHVEERLAEDLARSRRHSKPVSLLMIDVDHFNEYRNSSGHPEGDRALATLARCLRNGLRSFDVVGRFGEEEFAAILPETPKDVAHEVADRLRREVESVYFPGEESLPSNRLTVSIGIAAYPDDAEELKVLIQRSGRALSQARVRGGNRVAAYHPRQPAPGSQRSDRTQTRETSAANQAWTKLL